MGTIYVCLYAQEEQRENLIGLYHNPLFKSLNTHFLLFLPDT